MRSPPLFAFHCAAWLGSFLLFHLELLVAKMLLPTFGGSAYVWTTCVMTYQGLLLAGYAAYRWLAHRAGVARYAPWHIGLLLLGLCWAPLRLPEISERLLTHHPIAGLLLILTAGIGVPFLLLSMTSVLMQTWFAYAPTARGRPAHVLYATSNAGAFAALLAFPLLLEPFGTLEAQRRLWAAGYVLLVLLHAWCRPRRGTTAAPVAEPPVAAASTIAGGPLIWCLLSAASCAFMLAMTNVLMIELGAVSLCWVLPMAVYLLTWILTFRQRPWYPRWLPAAGCIAVVVVMLVQTFRPAWTLASFRHTTVYVLLFHAILFWVCMLCHYHLVASRPDATRLPRFYLWIAIGGWLGSVLISVVLPLAARHTSTNATDWIVAMLLVLVALIATERPALAAAVRRYPAPSGLVGLVVLALGAASVQRLRAPEPSLRYAVRNFYGISRVKDGGGQRRLLHGTTIHGLQSLDPARQDVPLAYYHPHGPLGQVFAQTRRVERIAAVGLGAGCVAAYLRAGQQLDVYELDPDVVAIAQRHFTYLQRSPVRSRIIIGDARRSLALAGDATYDLLILDAFGGDAIPIHLLTVEAFRLYLERLAPDGQIAVHVSSRHYRLIPVVAAVARHLGLAGAARVTLPFEVMAGEEFPSEWVVLGRTAASLQALRAAGWFDVQQALASRRMPPWTDQRTNVLAALAFGGQH